MCGPQSVHIFVLCEGGSFIIYTISKKFLFQVCPAGYYCDNRLAPVVLFTNSSCPVGHYCPAGTKMAYENKCPRGTFSNETGLENVTQCSSCPGGFYCPELGQSTFPLRCDAGT